MVPADLARYGFPTIASFQRAYNGGPWLAVDGIWGPNTEAAAAKLPGLSAHFGVDSDNLRSHGNHQCLVRRELLAALEVLRASIGRPVLVVDAYRDPAYNAGLPGAAHDSQHQYGVAADIAESVQLTVAEVRAAGVFSGFGYSVSTHHVRHVDGRHFDPVHNVTHSTIARPAIWTYP
jgi:uncharacterized protein YcbK (DUF882 family)